jgi:hypothetical protein
MAEVDAGLQQVAHRDRAGARGNCHESSFQIGFVVLRRRESEAHLRTL